MIKDDWSKEAREKAIEARKAHAKPEEAKKGRSKSLESLSDKQRNKLVKLLLKKKQAAEKKLKSTTDPEVKEKIGKWLKDLDSHIDKQKGLFKKTESKIEELVGN